MPVAGGADEATEQEVELRVEGSRLEEHAKGEAPGRGVRGRPPWRRSVDDSTRENARGAECAKRQALRGMSP